MYQAIRVDIPRVHPYRQIVALQQLQSVFFIFEQVLAFADFRYFQFFQTGLVFDALLNRNIYLIVHFRVRILLLTMVMLARPVAQRVENESILARFPFFKAMGRPLLLLSIIHIATVVVIAAFGAICIQDQPSWLSPLLVAPLKGPI